MNWLYEGVEYENLDTKVYGFVYEITNKITGRKYIGRKFLTQASYKQVKGKRKKVRKESDWKDYWGSSAELQEDIKLHGYDNFERRILKLCNSRSSCSYWESKFIFESNALIKDEYYNSWVSCRIHSKHLKGVTE
jgi:hypothetical protein